MSEATSDPTDPSMFWKPDDAAWMQARKREWVKVRTRLTAAGSYIPRKAHPAIKRYFFFGEPLPSGRGSPVPYSAARLIEWWLCPIEPSIDGFRLEGGVTRFREYVYRVCSAIRRGMCEQGDAEYGVLNGREQSLTLAMNPGLDHREMHFFGYRIHLFGPDVTEHACQMPGDVYQSCVHGTKRTLRSYRRQPMKPPHVYDFAFFAHEPGLVLWDHLSFALERYPELISDAHGCKELMAADWTEEGWIESNRQRIVEDESLLNEALRSIAGFFALDEDDEALRRRHAVRFVRDITGRLERGEFCPQIQGRWRLLRRVDGDDGSEPRGAADRRSPT